MSESTILRDVMIAVSRLPETMIWRNQTGALHDRQGRLVTFGLVGSADIIGVHKGRALAIECKAPRGRQSVPQQRFERAWKAAGGIYIVARSADDALWGIEHA